MSSGGRSIKIEIMSILQCMMGSLEKEREIKGDPSKGNKILNYML